MSQEKQHAQLSYLQDGDYVPPDKLPDFPVFNDATTELEKTTSFELEEKVAEEIFNLEQDPYLSNVVNTIGTSKCCACFKITVK